MNAYPLMRTKWTNEHVMAALFAVLPLYNLPIWFKDPSKILMYLLIIAVSLIVDTVLNFIRSRKPVCSVSGGVTGVMLIVLAPQTQLLVLLFGVIVALILGKHLWGGTGKNIVNPAITGYLAMVLLFKTPLPTFEPTLLLLPALLLGLPFILSRPFASVGFMAGMAAQLALSGNLGMSSLLSYGVLFWGCMVLTDPVTSTIKPFASGITGLLAGLLSLINGQSAITVALAILGFNIFSFAIDHFVYNPISPIKRLLHIKPILHMDKVRYIDLTEKSDESAVPILDISKKDIMERINISGVFGFGGAGFPTIRKIETAIRAYAPQKHLIINGVECDPGLVHDKWLVRNYAEEISLGAELLRKCIDFSSLTLAVKNTEGLQYPDSIRIHKVTDYYPAGAEKLLISEVLGVSLKDGTIPAEEGILVLNVQTLYAIYEAVAKLKKADTRFLTVADLRRNDGVVVKVGLSMKIRDIIDKIYPNSVYAFSGGGVMQAKQAQDDDIVGQTTNLIAAARFPKYKESPQCSRCGRCAICCPMGIQAGRIAEMIDKGDMSGVKRYHPEKCIACGSCSYVCLAGRNLAARVKSAKENSIS